MSPKSTALALIAVVAFSGTSFAQQVNTYSQMPMGSTYNPGYTPGYNPGYNPSIAYPSNTYPSNGFPSVVYPSYPSYPSYPVGNYYPSHPVVVTPNQVTGINPMTGGLNTANQQLNNTVFAPARNQSVNNGSGRWVNRPVFGAGGQVVGRQQGYVWNNSLTGQEHGQVNTLTPNGLGGVNNTATSYMTNGAPARPSIVTPQPNIRPSVKPNIKPGLRVPNGRGQLQQFSGKGLAR